MRLTENFNLREFRSKDGAETPEEFIPNIAKLAENLQVIRDEIKCPLHINSAYRSPSHNKSIGGVKNSQHLLGKAADLTSRNHSPKELYCIISNLIDTGKVSIKGMGLYKSFVHVDIRADYARGDKS